MRILRSVLTICFSLFLVGCACYHGGENWPIVQPPSLKKIEITPIAGGEAFYIDKNSAENLVNNIDSLKLYIKKLEALIDVMKKYYKAK